MKRLIRKAEKKPIKEVFNVDFVGAENREQAFIYYDNKVYFGSGHTAILKENNLKDKIKDEQQMAVGSLKTFNGKLCAFISEEHTSVNFNNVAQTLKGANSNIAEVYVEQFDFDGDLIEKVANKRLVCTHGG